MPQLAIPRTFDQVDARWLTTALHAGGNFFTRKGGAVVDVQRGDPVEGIAVTSTVLRLRLQLEPADAGPTAAVIKLLNPKWTRGSALHEREVKFYRELADDPSLPIPRCYYADFDEASGDFVVVIEDVGDAEPGHRLDGVAGPEAALLFDTLADLHSRWWESPRLRDADWPTKTYSRQRATDILATFRGAWPKLQAHDRFEVTDNLRQVVETIDDRFIDDLVGLSTGPRTLIHSDLHAENFVVDARTAPRIIAFDWQNASLANCVFDVANALTSLHTSVTRSERAALLAGYHRRLGVADYSAEQFHADVRAAVRWLFVGGANWFVVFEVERLRDVYTVQGHWKRLTAAITRL